MDRLRALEVLIAVVDAGSLAGASRRLALSAPSVTRIVNELERELGVLLLHRSTRAVTLTEPGVAFVDDARRLLTEYAEAADAARGAQRAPQGVLRLTAPVLFGQHYVLPVLLAYLDRYPGVDAQAVYLDRPVNLVDEGFDLAVRIGPLPASNLRATQLGEVRRVVVATPGYLARAGTPAHPADLDEHRVIVSTPSLTHQEWRFADGAVVRPQSRLSLSSVPAVIEAARHSWGITRVLSYQVGPDIEAGVLQPVLEAFEPEPLPVHILHVEGRRASAKVRAFVDLAAERLRAEPALGGGYPHDPRAGLNRRGGPA